MTLGPAIVSLGPRSAALALRLRALLPGSEIHSPACADCAADVRFAKAATHIAGLFAAGRPIVGLCASGILIRAVAPHSGRQDAPSPRSSPSPRTARPSCRSWAAITAPTSWPGRSRPSWAWRPP